MKTITYKPRSKIEIDSKSGLNTLLAAFFALVTSSAFAQGTGLTPSGAEQAGTASGIPDWSAPQPMTPGWTYGQLRKDFFQFKSDAPLYSIDATNVDKYSGQLNPGQIALIKSVKGYSMPVYPSRRTCGVPDFVANNTKKNVGFAKIKTEDNSLVDAYTPGIPFPDPKTGAEAMWNAKMRYRGIGQEQYAAITSVSPRKGSSDWIKVTADQYTYLPWAAKSGTTFAEAGRVENYIYFNYISPAAMAGQAATFTGAADKPAEAFYYFPGQRRTRRMPAYSYDAPQIGYESQYNIDESYVFAGLMDRFDWKLVGKKEMIVPYNALGMYDFKSKYEDVMQPDFVAASQRRYELHRVWVVEATVKQGMRHSAPKRTYYIDEDSWALVGAVDYDAQGAVSKVREGHVIPVYETGTCDSLAFIQYSLSSGRYVMDGSPLASGKDIKWSVDGTGNPHFKPGFYNPENLRAMSER
ncbi:DUF1329 domain-containing protein [Pseudomonas veronii]|uniref:DUF1329 domain-containing protein n=1 Tax=Pseudomonas veronii TaxID=76761 RepID=UPI0021C22AC9|nr:DUF1329 domain-containing protein [Pseudomonas veronii]MCT9826632.1 DUF1329 domain-containing protein [Pseudomonas veronii]